MLRVFYSCTFCAVQSGQSKNVIFVFMVLNQKNWLQVRTRNETGATVGLPCYKWPLALAAGYGRESPTTRYVLAASAWQHQHNMPMDMADDSALLYAAAAMSLADSDFTAAMDAGGACGACGEN